MDFKLAPLPFAEDALEPHISERTIALHYHKHHKGYLEKLDKALANDKRRALSLYDIVRASEGEVFNCAAQVWNHDFYWRSIEPGSNKTPPAGPLLRQIEADFESMDALQQELRTVAAGQFGSGWAWLIFDNATSRLRVTSTGDADNPLREGHLPLLTIDVWEHAYYLDYQNERDTYLDAVIGHLLNWEFAADNFELRTASRSATA